MTAILNRVILTTFRRYLRTTSIHQETDDAKKGIKFRFFAFSIYHHQLLPETTELLFYLNIVFWVKLIWSYNGVYYNHIKGIEVVTLLTISQIALWLGIFAYIDSYVKTLAVVRICVLHWKIENLRIFKKVRCNV